MRFLPRNRFGAVNSVSLTLAGQTLDLLPDRAAFWREQSAVLVADCHFGKAASLRRHGLAVPEGGTADDLCRLDSLIRKTGASRVIVVGDFFHAPSGYTTEVIDALIAWRHRSPDLRVSLVPGNHDRALHRLPAALALDLVEEPLRVGRLRFVHDPAATSARLDHDGTPIDGWVCGHLHPAVRLGDRRVRGVSAPCFWLMEGSVLVLPSFGSFTGAAAVRPGTGDRIFAVTPGRVLEVPPALLGIQASPSAK